MRSTLDSIPSICAPSETRKRQRSWTCGSHAALPITVSPSASTAAMTAFSVPITLASSRKTCLPRRRSACELERAVDLTVAPSCSKRMDVDVEPPASDHVAARRRQRRSAEARDQRTGEEERRADARRQARVDLGLRHVRPSTRHLVRADPLDLGAEVVEQLDHRLDVADPRDVRERDRFEVSRVAAMIGSAPFLFPAARTRPFRGRPPSITKDSASVSATMGSSEAG